MWEQEHVNVSCLLCCLRYIWILCAVLVHCCSIL
jgi:hypothetical protein